MIEADTIGTLLLDMFAYAPIPICISTGGVDARYVKANDAYLALVGHSWEELRNRDMLTEGAAIASPERDRRMQLLSEAGSYSLEEVTIRHADGHAIPCLISARRTTLGGETYDVEIILDITERRRMQREIEYYLRRAALTDPLTDLPNRAGFDRQLETAMQEAAGSENRTTLLAFLDVNKFKEVNDGYGHAVGDRLLQEFAGRLRDEVGAQAFTARLGGDEFAVIYRIDRSQVAAIADKLGNTLNRICRPFEIEGQVLRIGSSCGLAAQDPARDTPQLLLQRADRQMYLAKAEDGMVNLAASAEVHAAAPLDRAG